jgi:hypothetical protein
MAPTNGAAPIRDPLLTLRPSAGALIRTLLELARKGRQGERL